MIQVSFFTLCKDGALLAQLVKHFTRNEGGHKFEPCREHRLYKIGGDYLDHLIRRVAFFI